jgi:hypothetical protein
MAPCHISLRYGEWRFVLSAAGLSYWGIHIGVRIFRRWVFVQKLSLSMCPGGHLAYLKVELGLGKRGLEPKAVSIVFLFCCIFQLSCPPSFVVLFLSFTVLCVVSSLLSRLLFTGSSEESFYSQKSQEFLNNSQRVARMQWNIDFHRLLVGI